MSTLFFDSENSSGASCTNALNQGSILSSITGRWIVPNALPMKENQARYSLVTLISLAQGVIGAGGSSLENVNNNTVVFQIGSAYASDKSILGFKGYRAYFTAGTDDYHPITNFTISPGDTLYGNICFSGGSLFMALANETTNTAFSVGYSPSDFQPNWAGWIVGIPAIEIGLALEMAKYGAVVFDDVTATLSNDASIAPQGTIPYANAGIPPNLSQCQIENDGHTVVCEYVGAYPS